MFRETNGSPSQSSGKKTAVKSCEGIWATKNSVARRPAKLRRRLRSLADNQVGFTVGQSDGSGPKLSPRILGWSWGLQVSPGAGG